MSCVLGKLWARPPAFQGTRQNTLLKGTPSLTSLLMAPCLVYVLLTTSRMESPALIAQWLFSVYHSGLTWWFTGTWLAFLQNGGLPAVCQVQRWTPLVHSAGPCAQDAGNVRVPGGAAHVGLPVTPWRADGHGSDSDETV